MAGEEGIQPPTTSPTGSEAGPGSEGVDIPQFNPVKRPEEATPEEREAEEIRQAVQEAGGPEVGAEAGLKEAADVGEQQDARTQEAIDSAVARVNKGEDPGAVLVTTPEDLKGSVKQELDKLGTQGAEQPSVQPSLAESAQQDEAKSPLPGGRLKGESEEEYAARRQQLDKRHQEETSWRQKEEDETLNVTAPFSGVEPASEYGLNNEAVDLLNKVEAGGVPTVVTPNLEKIARDNGVDPENMNPNQIIAALRTKSAGQIGSIEPAGEQSPPKPEAEIDTGGGAEEPPTDEKTTAEAEEPGDNAPHEGESRNAEERQRARAKREMRSEFRGLEPEDLKDTAEDAQAEYDEARENYRDLVNSRKATPDQIDRAEARMNRLRERKNLANAELRRRKNSTGESATKRQKEGAVKARLETAKKFEGMGKDSLKTEIAGIDAQLEDAKDQLDTADDETRQILEGQISQLESQQKIAQRTLDRKEGEGKKSDEERELDEAEERHSKALNQVGSAEFFEAKLKVAKADFDKKQNEINQLENKLKSTTDEAQKKELGEQLKKLKKEAADFNDQIQEYDEGLKTAKERARNETALDDRFTEEDLPDITREQWRQMSDAERVKYMDEIRKNGKMITNGKARELRNAIMKGEALSPRERAQFSEWFSHKLQRQGGREAVDLETAQMMMDRYPEMFEYTMDKVAAHNENLKAFKELNPNGWEKMWNFAKRNKHWLMILLAIAAGAVLLPAGAGAAMGAGRRLI